MECFATKADTEEFHPLNYQQLRNAQDKDKTIQKILKMPNTLYACKDFHGAGNITSLICFKEKIVIPGWLETSKACCKLVSHHSLSPWYKPNRKDTMDNTFGGKNCEHL
jgi:hypothetical protein